jgi:hypothetical protein
LIELLRGGQVARDALKLLLHERGSVDARLKLCQVPAEPALILAKNLQLRLGIGDGRLEPLGIRIDGRRRRRNTSRRRGGADSGRRRHGRLWGCPFLLRELRFRIVSSELLYHVGIRSV